MKKLYASVLVALFLTPLDSSAISVFAETFASPSSTSWSSGAGGAINNSIWSVYTTGQHGARITSGRLEITDRRASSTAHGQGFAFVPCGGAGSQFDNNVYSSTLKNNGGIVTWTFNMRKSYTSNGGFSCSSSSSQNYVTTGLAFVLATSSAQGMQHNASGTCSPNGTAFGYAVVLGGSNTTRLVRFANALHNGQITDIAVSAGFTVANYRSVRVTYNPANDQWTLEVRNDGSSAFSDPSTGTYPAPSVGTDATHVLSPLNFMGGYFQAGCIGVCDDAAYLTAFDNVRVDVACVAPAAPGPITGGNQVCQSVSGTYSIDAVPGSQGYLWSYSGTGVTITPNGTTATLAFGANATSGTLSVVNVGECNSAPSNLPIVVQLLPGAPAGLSGPVSICAGTSVTYSVNAVGGETYAWTLPPGWSGQETGASITTVVAAPGGVVSVVAANGCGNGPASTINVQVDPLPVVTLDPFGLICVQGSTFPMTGGSPAGGTYTYNGVAITSFNPVVGVGLYPITYNYTDANGCTGFASQILEVDACAGIDELSSMGVSVFPNPVMDDVLYVDGPLSGELMLLDAAGRIVVRQWHAGATTTIHVGNCTAGHYVLLLRGNDGNEGRARVVIGH
jgi:hypothetical protein